MSDDKSKAHGQDRERINIHEDYELRDWAKTLKTTPERVKNGAGSRRPCREGPRVPAGQIASHGHGGLQGHGPGALAGA
jgi:hypothetical protein